MAKQTIVLAFIGFILFILFAPTIEQAQEQARASGMAEQVSRLIGITTQAQADKATSFLATVIVFCIIASIVAVMITPAATGPITRGLSAGGNLFAALTVVLGSAWLFYAMYINAK